MIYGVCMRFLKKLYQFFHYKVFGGVAHARFLGVKVGSGSRLLINDWGTEPYLITIGNDVTITGGVKLLTHDGSACLVKNKLGRYFKYGKVNIGSSVFIGTNSIIMPGVNIADNVVIGAGSVVTKSILKSGIYAGSPARHIKTYEAFQIKMEAIGTQSPASHAYKSDRERVMGHIQSGNV